MRQSHTASRWHHAGILTGALLISAGVALTPAAETAPGWFGMRLDIDTDGAREAIVKSVRIRSVYPDSPAARAHVAKGDELLEAEGQPVGGSKARQLQSLLQKAVGQALHLRLKRRTGESYTAVLVAAPLP